jgi:hypothetical protein
MDVNDTNLPNTDLRETMGRAITNEDIAAEAGKHDGFQKSFTHGAQWMRLQLWPRLRWMLENFDPKATVQSKSEVLLSDAVAEAVHAYETTSEYPYSHDALIAAVMAVMMLMRAEPPEDAVPADQVQSLAEMREILSGEPTVQAKGDESPADVAMDKTLDIARAIHEACGYIKITDEMELRAMQMWKETKDMRAVLEAALNA